MKPHHLNELLRMLLTL